MTAALSPQAWPFDLSLLPPSAHLVGGSVRDALLDRTADYLDLDFVLPEAAVETARTIARHHQAGFVVLDVTHQIARVVFDRATVDFAQQVGDTLAEDLHRRDFTVNAIAYHPHTEQIFDPLRGCADLDRRVLRMVSPDNLADDPLRLLRAYRQAAQLGFTLDSQTRQTIHQLSPLLGRMAAERVRGELDCLLSLSAGTPLLQLAWQDGLLQDWFPQLQAQPLQILGAIDGATQTLETLCPAMAEQLPEWLKEHTPPGCHRSWLKATKLSQVIPETATAAEAELTRLKYSRAEQQAVLAILRGWQYLQAHPGEGLSSRQQYHLFKITGPSFVGLALLACALGYPQGPLRLLCDRFLAPTDPVAHPQPLVSGREVMAHFNLRPGPRIGVLLAAVELAHAEGQVTTSTEALSWLEMRADTLPPSQTI
ncbi:MAG: CCA tRNA nucleotidyltransferase [Leptolyngbya sp. RL_3_1]|nr:CCA tRNA nucleotidyltransferase [Leptolyngbya sp. RL_3_1]